MRSICVIVAAATLTVASAFAADTRTEAPHNPAVKTTEGNNPGAPAAGANSFTQGEARSRIAKMGYTNISALKKDKDGIWHGKARHEGKSTNVSLDYQGNVVAQ